MFLLSVSHMNYYYFVLPEEEFNELRNLATPLRHRRIPEAFDNVRNVIVPDDHKLWLQDRPQRSADTTTQTSSVLSLLDSDPGPSTVTTTVQIEPLPSTQINEKLQQESQGKFDEKPSRHPQSCTRQAPKFCDNALCYFCDHRLTAFDSEYDKFILKRNKQQFKWTTEPKLPIDLTALGNSPSASRNTSPVCKDYDDLESNDNVTCFKGIKVAQHSPYRQALIASKPVSTGAIKKNIFSGSKINIIVNPVPSPAPCSPTGYPKPKPVFDFDDFEAYPLENLMVDDNDCQNISKKYNREKQTRDSQANKPMGRMNPLEDHERKVIIEFCHLLEKSKQLFNGLRELPQYGHQQWHSYFGRTFDVYTKLWKFQQQHRAILDSKYGLKRWQIGEIASKIGQLYYHFYLRTSETAYLTEAFSFYYAIRGRCYYTKACKEDKCELMVKKLRYYARFIVVCLLLKKIKLVRELTKELDRQIVEYGNTYDPDDQIEWTVVVDEVKAFIQADPMISVVHPDNYPVILSYRMTAHNLPPVERSSSMTLSLQEALIIGSTSQQVKFSELTIDMFRMLQSLEREPSENPQHLFDDSPRQRSFIPTPSVPIHKGYNLENGPRRENPHKYLLYKPSPMQMLVYLSNGCQDLPVNGALLLYISADGQIVHQGKHTDDVGYDTGGLITTSKNDIYRECTRNSEAKAGPVSKHKEYKELQCLHPGDLSPFTRRPLFIIIDSDNSYVFQHVPRHFGQPLVILMSPLDLPQSYIADRKQQGSLFTMFLHAPLAAFCYISDIHNVSLATWDRGMVYIDTFLAEASQLLTRSRIDPMYIAFMGDDFLRLFILRFIFCEATLRLHRGFRSRTQLTRASPPLPEELYDHPALVHVIMDLASHLQVRGHFHDPTAGPPPTKE